MGTVHCDYFTKICRSCTLLEVDAAHEKEKHLHRTYERFLQQGTRLEPLIDGRDALNAWPAGSRTRAKMVVSGYAHAPVIGVEAGARESVLRCLLHHPAINEVVSVSVEAIRNAGLPPYQVEKKKGELKYLHIKHAPSTGETLVRIVLRSKEALERAKRFAAMLQEALRHVVVVSVNIQPQHAALSEGPEEIVLTEQKEITERCNGLTLKVSPQSFSQVTFVIAEKLYRCVAGQIKEAGCEYLLDLYCGGGAFALHAAQVVRHVTGVELNDSAIAAAQRAAIDNNIQNATFFAADAERYLDSLQRGTFDALIVNPPRRGLSPSINHRIIAVGPSMIVYSSCNPETQILDLMILKEQFDVLSLQPFDMFPLSNHVEVVAVLRRR